MIYEVIKIDVDLNIQHSLFSESLYVYLHFLIVNISIELIDIFESKISILNKKDEIKDFKIILYLFAFRYFEFNKIRRMITNKVLLSEIEQTMINCVELIIKDKKKKEKFKLRNYKRSKKSSKKFKKLLKFPTFVYSFQVKQKILSNSESTFSIYDNIKDLLIYLIESSIIYNIGTLLFQYINIPRSISQDTRSLKMIKSKLYLTLHSPSPINFR